MYTKQVTAQRKRADGRRALIPCTEQFSKMTMYTWSLRDRHREGYSGKKGSLATDQEISSAYKKTKNKQVVRELMSSLVARGRALFVLLFFCYLLFQHDFQDGFICQNHPIMAQCPHVLDSLPGGVADNPVSVLDVDSMQ